MRGLYAIVDVDHLRSSGVDPVAHAREIAAARPAAIQLRAKSSGAADTLERLRALRLICNRSGVPLYANDRPDLALMAGCDGVHLGQEDLHPTDVRRFAPGLKWGVSTHDLEQVRAALVDRPDYVALGPLYATGSKRNPEPVVAGEVIQGASRLCRDAGVPLVGIGGIDEARAARLAKWVDAVAVIGALTPRDDAVSAARLARRLMRSFAGTG